MNKTITEMKNMLEGINCRITKAEEEMSNQKTEYWKSLAQNRIQKREGKEDILKRPLKQH